MSAAQLRHLQELYSVVLGGIETDNISLSLQALARMKAEIDERLFPEPLCSPLVRD